MSSKIAKKLRTASHISKLTNSYTKKGEYTQIISLSNVDNSDNNYMPYFVFFSTENKRTTLNW